MQQRVVRRLLLVATRLPTKAVVTLAVELGQPSLKV